MLSSETVEKIRTELNDLYTSVSADTLSARDRSQTIRGNQTLSCIQRMLDLLPPD